MTTWLLCDYGEVLSRPHPAAAVAELAALAGVDGARFPALYWEHRVAYDRGELDAAAYWATVVGADPGHRLERLVAVDVAGWLIADEASVDGARTAALVRGWRLALLSNAPREVALAVDAQPWLAAWEPRLFSWALGTVKPEPEIYAAALERLGAAPEEVVFVDDRPANVEAATRAGIRAVAYAGPTTWGSLEGA